MRTNLSTENLSPTFAEMASRFRSKARHCAWRAERLGLDTPQGRQLLGDAARYYKVANGLAERQLEILYARDGLLAEYRAAKVRSVRPELRHLFTAQVTR
jgi:hypothetical protein